MGGPNDMNPLAVLAEQDRIVIDTMFWIYLFEDAPRYGAFCARIIQAASEGLFRAIVTPVTAAELLVKPLMQNRKDIAERYRRALLTLPNVESVPVTLETGCLAGALRSKYRLPLPDMIQVACALLLKKPALLTNDKALCRIAEVKILLLDDMLGE